MNNYDNSVYNMGHDNKLTEENCTISALAKEIYLIEHPDEKNIDEKYINTNANDLGKIFYRKGGYIDQIKKHLNLDLEQFDKNNFQFQREKFKILFLFYRAKNFDFKGIEVIQLLANPSMEILDTSFYGRQTHYGNISKFFIERLANEISPIRLLDNEYFKEITMSWLVKLEEIEENSLHYNGYIELILEKYKNILSNIEFPECCETYEFSPIEMLYLRIKQKNYIGQIKDVMLINGIKSKTQYDTPPEMIEDMRRFAKNEVTDINECIDKFINNPKETAKYVYKKEASSYEINKIKEMKERVIKTLSFCNRSDLSINVEEFLTELHIISCLQAILLDSKNEVFNYHYYDYKHISKKMPHVQAALKNDNYVLDALKLYWHRKINDHWYANIGKYYERCKLRELENVFDDILLKIFSYNNLSEIYNTHCYIFDKLPNISINNIESLV